jgi:L-ascorbate metabolism protein UlaG (beta-lactamase superfamily)
MKLTKYAHACAVLEEQGKRLVIDPGVFTELPDLTDVVAIIITHVHPDHVSPELLQRVLAANPQAIVFSTDETAAEHGRFPITTVTAGQTVTIGPFKLMFTGGVHAKIHDSLPRNHNVGVIVNDGVLYFPGDSFVIPEVPVQTLLIPAAAPWMRIGEAIDFLAAVKPQRAIPTHDAILSEQGKQIHDSHLNNKGIVYQRLAPGESIEI